MIIVLLSTSSDGALYFYQVPVNISKGLRVTERTRYPTKIFKGHNTNKNVVGGTVLSICTSSDDALYLYQVW